MASENNYDGEALLDKVVIDDEGKPNVGASPQRRNDIDGLRALAVFAVIVFHANPAWLPGGFAGVDMFFTISGYVNTVSLLHGCEDTCVDTLNFYGRRMWRLAPALMATVLITTILNSVLMLPSSPGMDGYYISGLLGLVGLSNNYFASLQLDYFENGHSHQELNPFMHLWSLGVEEQFYVLFPFLLSWARKLQSPAWVIAVCAVISMLVSCILTCSTYSNAQVAFYILPSRFWELALGACVFHIMPNYAPGTDTIANGVRYIILQVASLLLLIVGLLFTPSGWGFPFPWASLSVGGTLCFIAAGSSPNAILNACFGSKFLVYIGNLSYALYLWHWPVLVFMRGTECLKSPTSMVIVFAITLALAMATYHLMEAPLHKRRPKQTSNIFGILLPLLAITALISWSLGFYYVGAVYVDATCSDGATTSSTAATANSSSHEVCSGGGGWHGNPLTWHPDKSSSCPMNFSWSSYARHCGEDASDVTHSRFLFLGDSTMNLLYSRLRPIFDSAWHDTAVSKNDCDRMEFLGLDPAPEWVPPPQGFAPLFKGLTHPYCQDTPSLRCYRGQVSVASGNVSKQCVLDFEYVPMEYAIDVSLQTNETNTTQGTIAAYVKKRYGSVDAIITNQGLHDFYIETMSADDYVESVREQLLAFQGSVTVIVWILINHIFEDPVQTPFITNARCAQWNEAVTDMISSEFPNVYILDAYKMSKLQSMHKDRFHMTLDYYDVLADIVLSFAIPNADQ